MRRRNLRSVLNSSQQRDGPANWLRAVPRRSAFRVAGKTAAGATGKRARFDASRAGGAAAARGAVREDRRRGGRLAGRGGARGVGRAGAARGGAARGDGPAGSLAPVPATLLTAATDRRAEGLPVRLAVGGRDIIAVIGDDEGGDPRGGWAGNHKVGAPPR